MRLIVPILLNCLLVLTVYLMDKYTPAKKMPYMAKQAIIGLLFGGVSAFGGSEEPQTSYASRDAEPQVIDVVEAQENENLLKG